MLVRYGTGSVLRKVCGPDKILIMLPDPLHIGFPDPDLYHMYKIQNTVVPYLMYTVQYSIQLYLLYTVYSYHNLYVLVCMRESCTLPILYCGHFPIHPVLLLLFSPILYGGYLSHPFCTLVTFPSCTLATFPIMYPCYISHPIL